MIDTFVVVVLPLTSKLDHHTPFLRPFVTLCFQLDTKQIVS